MYAQTDTVFYGDYGNLTSREDAHFYRIKPVKKRKKYHIKSFYLSGALQMSGYSLSDTEDIFDGEVTWYYKSGNIMQKTSYSNGVKEGKEVLYDKHGNTLAEGVFKNNTPFMGACYKREEKYLLIGHYNHGELVSVEVIDLPGGSQAKICKKKVLKNGQPHYKFKYYDQKGNYLGQGTNTDDNVHDGLLVKYSYNPMNVLTIEKYTHGVVDTTLSFYKGGQMRSLKTATAENTEEEIFFSPDGQAIDTLTLKNGQPYEGGYLEFYKTGQPKERGCYQDSRKEGEVSFWYKNGKPCCKGTYKDGYKREGEFLEEYTKAIYTFKNHRLKETRYYHSNGQLQRLHLDGSMDICYDSTGQEISRMTYKGGRPYEGTWVEYDWGLTSKRAKEEKYKQGKLVWTKYYASNGSLSEENIYESGKKVKKTVYYTSGEKMILTTYSQNRKEHITYYDKEGNILGTLSDDGQTKHGKEYIFTHKGNGRIWEVKDYEKGKTTHVQGYSYSGQLLFEQDYNGMGRSYNQWGRLIAEGTFRNGQPYEGTFYEYDYYNHYIETKASFRQGKYHGQVIHYRFSEATFSNKRTTVQQYKDGKLHGLVKGYHDGIHFYSIPYMNGSREGEAIYYNAYGQELSRAKFQNDQPYEGTVYEYTMYKPYLDKSVQYSKGVKNGKEIHYDWYGNPKKTYTYKSGELVKEIGSTTN
ncbi:hypothetical protein GCM10009122_47990 [Fulvivirga kasyanovii]